MLKSETKKNNTYKNILIFILIYRFLAFKKTKKSYNLLSFKFSSKLTEKVHSISIFSNTASRTNVTSLY